MHCHESSTALDIRALEEERIPAIKLSVDMHGWKKDLKENKQSTENSNT